VPAPKPEGFPRERRLLRSSDFARVERQGRRAAGAFVVVVSRPGRGRVGLAVSKKVGNAVVRNSVKRRLREILRRHKELFEGKDLVLIAQPAAAGQSLALLEADVRAALERLPESREHEKARPRRR
jgi:ribonuclease P protein component